jgi:hypothetical protein
MEAGGGATRAHRRASAWAGKRGGFIGARVKDRNGKLERGEWMGADKNSIQEFGLWTQFHSCNSASFSCQVHVATGVLLNLGARPNQQPQHTRSGNTHDTAAGSPNRSGRFLKPVRPLLLDLAWRRQGKPVRPILSRNSPNTPNTSKAFPHLNKWSHRAAKTSLLKDLPRQPTGRNRSDRLGKPVRPV